MITTLEQKERDLVNQGRALKEDALEKGRRWKDDAYYKGEETAEKGRAWANDAYRKGEQTAESLKRDAYAKGEQVADEAESVKRGAYAKGEEVADKGREVADDAYHKKEAFKRDAYSKGEEAADKAESLKRGAYAKGEDVADKAGSLKDAAYAKGEEAVDGVKSVGERIKHTALVAEQKVAGVFGHASEEADKFKSEHHLKEGKHRPEEVIATTSNPMVNEKISKYKTKTPSEEQLESHSEQHVHDTSKLVHKDTKKVKPVWTDEKASSPLETHVFSPSEEQRGWFRRPSRTDKVPPNPMVQEKESRTSTKQDWEVDMELKAKNDIHDNSSLVEKDTKKVSVVWDAKNGRTARTEKEQESRTFWDTMFGRPTEDQVSGDMLNVAAFRREELEREAQSGGKAKSAWTNPDEFIGSLTQRGEQLAKTVSAEGEKLAYRGEQWANDMTHKGEKIAHDLGYKKEKLKGQVKHEVDELKGEAAQTLENVKPSLPKLKTGRDEKWSADHHKVPAEVLVAQEKST
ncbi:hypothetical protein BDB01DRAFT_354257 [Pilobolus umbonatus]|nr:hypothetical protein BDB01DRAFT_354257 [Pilobolus umbonatus]